MHQPDSELRHWQHLFEKHGFFWSDELRDLVQEYGIKEKVRFMDGSDEIKFLDPSYIRVGAQYGTYAAASEYLHQRVSPVGNYHNSHIDLLLTETGRLVGFCDYLLIGWEDQHWRTAIPLILRGQPSYSLGVC